MKKILWRIDLLYLFIFCLIVKRLCGVDRLEPSVNRRRGAVWSGRVQVSVPNGWVGRAVVAGCKIAVLSAEPVEPIVRGRRRTRRCCCRRPSAAAAAAVGCIREEEERKEAEEE